MLNKTQTARMISEFRQSPVMVIMDTEQTCWEGSWERRQAGNILPTDLREVIQIGAVRVETAGFTVTDRFELVVRPKVNPGLSEFCSDFTGISQERLDREGLDFASALAKFEGFVAGAPVLVYNADEFVLRENVELNGLEATIPEYLRLKERLEACGVDMAGVNSGAIARHLGSTKTYREHDALADVTSMADGLAILARTVDADTIGDIRT